jgi:hypothetical protein
MRSASTSRREPVGRLSALTADALGVDESA